MSQVPDDFDDINADADPTPAENRAEGELRRSFAWTVGGFIVVAAGLLTDRPWSEWASGIGLATTALGAGKMIQAARRAGQKTRAERVAGKSEAGSGRAGHGLTPRRGPVPRRVRGGNRGLVRRRRPGLKGSQPPKTED